MYIVLLKARPATDVYVEVQSRHVEIYSANLYIYAHFTGLRYLMFNWPLLSAAVGVSSNLFFLGVICALSWCHLTRNNEDEEEEFAFKGDFGMEGESSEHDLWLKDQGHVLEMSSGQVHFTLAGVGINYQRKNIFIVGVVLIVQ